MKTNNEKGENISAAKTEETSAQTTTTTPAEEDATKKADDIKSDVYHLIILDESGSMSCVKGATISGCNETLNTIRSLQKEFADSQNHFVSIFAFQGGGRAPSRYIIKNEPADNVRDITTEYEPWGNTPLFDAIGSTLADLKLTVKDKPFATCNVTIITDGYENSSTHYTGEKVAKMIESLKEMGWNFNFIGANIDVEVVSRRLNIDNAMAFFQTNEETAKMFREERESRRRWAEKHRDSILRISECRLNNPKEDAESAFREEMKKNNKGYFKKD